MRRIPEIRKRYSLFALLLFFAVSSVCLGLGLEEAAKGLALGALFSVLNFFIMAELLPLQIGKGKRARIILNMGTLIGRYFILAIPLVISLKSGNINFAAVMVGIFAIQISILLDNLVVSKIRLPQRG